MLLPQRMPSSRSIEAPTTRCCRMAKPPMISWRPPQMPHRFGIDGGRISKLRVIGRREDGKKAKLAFCRFCCRECGPTSDDTSAATKASTHNRNGTIGTVHCPKHKAHRTDFSARHLGGACRHRFGYISPMLVSGQAKRRLFTKL